MENLPNELLDAIAFHLSLADLKLFSLTCHRIRDVSVRHLFRRIKLTYGLSDERIQQAQACYSCYVRSARNVRDIQLITESKSFYHYNVQGCHGSIIRDSLMPFSQLERLDFFEQSETSWHDFFSIIKRQLETKPNLRYLALQPNLGERGRGPKFDQKDKKLPWLQEPLPKLQTLCLSFFGTSKKIRGHQIERVDQFIEMIRRLKQVTESLQTLILDGYIRIRIEAWRTPLLTCEPLSFPRLESLEMQELRLLGTSISNILTLETLRNIRILSSGRPENWTTDTEILDCFLPFSNLRELRLFHLHDYFRCSPCKSEHRIFHVPITPALEDVKLLSKHLPRLEVVKWYSAYAPPLLFRYLITRNKDGSADFTLKRTQFEKVVFEDGAQVCSDYHGKYPELEILPFDDDGFPPRINWQDLVWIEQGRGTSRSN
ncbi:hypothetical protein TWF718_002456 [Orbilia javanica]|uniref:F-box domain-containing protein n=1 Tax=Orbilia javanica TaxID=47235 RepID=A0AAN8MQJ7_9PEZI